ncbi:prevent-host-death family protein [Modicisalibacter ilicicola DSM 19980]|uniref:Antitoxin n=1 Tax=Modicisalibacter ilicicola DSM 19980 TaxID=1121942 RepID=A0A1M4TL64_9GAMM|nr:type II toxin-antitoxin system prevent-host-death family antitoxin [Halomonas ilicicola]SHE45168.1 prevent-host-death family protein [Halomonas ilicicola DSM 19980]
MEIINMHDAKTRLSQLVDKAAQGEPFIIAKAGKPIARVTAIDSPEPGKERRLGFLEGQLAVPEDFDRMGEREISELFGG